MKDFYMQYALAGDEFVDYCLYLLLLLQAELGVLPPHFANWIGGNVQQKLVATQFPMIHQIVGFGMLSCMCVACFMFHLNYLIGFTLNHVASIASQVLQQE
ncbi:hypothetical protein ACA910_002732 [Epithemia clementina (nom. ined.)]